MTDAVLASAAAVPHSDEAEQSVLGALLIEPAAFERVCDALRPEAFFVPAHRAIWSAIAALWQRGAGADVVAVHEALRERGQDDIAGIDYLHALSVAVPSASNLVRHAEIVANKAAQRELIAAAGEALDVARATSGDLVEKLDRIGGLFSALQRTQMRRAPVSLSDAAKRALERFDALQTGTAEPGWATGIGPLDNCLNGGLRPGKVYGVAARPSVGKSSAARSMALRLSESGHPVLVLSQEMPVDEVTDCLIAQVGRVDSSRLQTGRLEHDDWHAVLDAVEQVANLPMWIDDQGGLTISDVAGKARLIKGLRVLVLDYLQLCASTLKNGNTNDQVAEISKGLKRLALDLGIAVVVLSQLNRQVEMRADREPVLSDLRDSGAIEQDLDVAVLLWTVAEPDGQHRAIGWKVAKNRGGAKGRWLMYFDAPRYGWLEAAETIEQARARFGGSAPQRKGGYE